MCFHVCVFFRSFFLFTYLSVFSLLLACTSVNKGLYTVSQKTGPLFTAYNCRNSEQIFTKLGINDVLFMLNITS